MKTSSTLGLQKCGWSGPHPLLSEYDAEELAAKINAVRGLFCAPEELRSGNVSPDFRRRPWFKSLHAYIPEVFALVKHPLITSRVIPILGDNVLAWGASITTRRPGQIHRWHVDIEHARWEGVTVFLGLSGLTNAGLTFIDGSDDIPAMPQQFAPQTDDDSLTIARRFKRNARLSRPPMVAGSFLVFKGRMWHASLNSGDAIRHALILQYCATSQDLAIPLNWDFPIRWHECVPPCVLAAGVASPYDKVVKSPIPLDSLR